MWNAKWRQESLAMWDYLGRSSISMMMTSKIYVEDSFQWIPLRTHEGMWVLLRSGSGRGTNGQGPHRHTTIKYRGFIPSCHGNVHVNGEVYYEYTQVLLVSSRIYQVKSELICYLLQWSEPTLTTTQTKSLFSWLIDNPYIEYLLLNCRPITRQTKVGNS